MEKARSLFKSFRPNIEPSARNLSVEPQSTHTKSTGRMCQTPLKWQRSPKKCNFNKDQRRSVSCFRPKTSTQSWLLSSKNGICNLVEVTTKKITKKKTKSAQLAPTYKALDRKIPLRQKWCHVSSFNFQSLPEQKKQPSLQNLLKNLQKVKRFRFK